MKALIDGISTGFFLQLALGPVFFLILNVTLNYGLPNGIYAALGVTLVDFGYIALSFLGIGKLLEKKSARFLLGWISSIVLVLFGVVMIYAGVVSGNNSAESMLVLDSGLKSFFAGVVLTVSSPLTIVFWSSVFTAKAIERNYSKKSLALFGLGAGSATPLFLIGSIILVSLVNSHIPDIAIKLLNIGVGIILTIYGILRFQKTWKQRRK